MPSMIVKGVGSMMRSRGSMLPFGILSDRLNMTLSSSLTLKGSSTNARDFVRMCPARPQLAFQAASRCSRVIIPRQCWLTPSPVITGNITVVVWSASRTWLTCASGGRIACAGSGSQSWRATTSSRRRGGSPSMKGSSLLWICSSSCPRSLICQFTASDTATLSMTIGASVRSFTHSTTMRTTAKVICLKPQSIAALPTTA
mmetsp:Transcript_52238/g.146972  ORF Transcript_52238/g.146972 Transcript_52238/m.146972 type:complete len:201 (-) Transcript_52238:1447-2049(-)